jgi:TP901 family phage tail tape measure protein
MAKGITVPVTQTGLSQSIQNAVKQVGGISVPVDIDSRSFKNLSQPLGRITGLATEFEKSIAASNARVIAFGASVGIINGIQGAFAELLRTGVEVQKILADIAAISGQSGAELSKFGDSIFDVAKNTSQSFKVAAQAALEFSRQGLTTDETIRRTNDALTLVRFTTLNAAEAVDVLTAATNSFSDTGITTSEILNKLVAVDTKFAVSAEDLANGLARAGSIAQEVGVSFDELNAAITITQERTARGGAVIGNALKTIFTRLRSDETVNALRSIGVESLNAQGGLKGAIPLLQEVATKIENLSGGERVQILEAIASKYNINILSALLNDLNAANGKFAEVVQISGGAQNQAYERQIELNKTLAAQINLTTVSVTQLFNKLAEIGVTESLTSILKFVNDLLDGFNKLLDSETTGGNIAKGLIKGISDVFFTVGLPIIGAIFIKLTKDIAQFGVESLKTILGINQQVRERQALEQAVVNTLIKDRDVMASILALSGDRAKQEEYLLNVYNRQISALERVQSIATSVAPALVQGGLSATSGTVKRRAADGYLPAQEAADVKRGVGGADKNAKVVKIPNFSFGGGKKGTMYANTSEYIVPNYNGGDGTAIFNKDMVSKYGKPENAKKINAATGYIPNYIKTQPKNIQAIRQGKKFEQSLNLKLFGEASYAANAILDFPKPEGFGADSEVKKELGINPQSEYGDAKRTQSRKSEKSLLDKYLRTPEGSAEFLNAKETARGFINLNPKGLSMLFLEQGQDAKETAYLGTKESILSEKTKDLIKTKFGDKKASKTIAMPYIADKINKSELSAKKASTGYIPNFADGKYIYDSDRLPADKNALLKKILASKVKKNLILGPAGTGKTTFAAAGGTFITKPEDADKATEIDILSGAARTKDGGVSANLESIISAVNVSGGKVSYLYAGNMDIIARRSNREEKGAGEGDLRSEKQIAGTKYAPLNQFDFIEKVKTKARNFGIVKNAVDGYIPNFQQQAVGEKQLTAKEKELKTKAEKVINNRVGNTFGTAAMLVKDQADEQKVRTDKTYPWGFEPKEPENKIFGRVKFPVYGLKDSGLQQAKLGAVPKIKEPLDKIALDFGTSVSSDLAGRQVSQAEYQQSYKKSFGAAGAFGGVVGGIFESAARVAFNFESDKVNTLDVPNIPDPMRLAFGITGGERSADLKGSVSDGVLRGFASQAVKNNLVKEEIREMTNAPKKVAAKGFVPNYAEKLTEMYDWDGTIIPKISGKPEEYIQSIQKLEKKDLLPVGKELAASKEKFDIATARPIAFKDPIKNAAQNLGLNVEKVFPLGSMFENRRAQGKRGPRKLYAPERKALFAERTGRSIVDDEEENLMALGSRGINANLRNRAAIGFIPSFAEGLKQQDVLAPSGQFYDLDTADAFLAGSSINLDPASPANKGLGQELKKKILDSARRVYGPKAQIGISRLPGQREAFTSAVLANPALADDFIALQKATTGGVGPAANTPDALAKFNNPTPFDPTPWPAIRATGGKARAVKKVGPRSLTAAFGFVPNFADPLEEAVDREIAAGVKPSQVRVTRDDRLTTTRNPEGLAVINTRDEPNGKVPSNRINEKNGKMAAKGFVPNFAISTPKGGYKAAESSTGEAVGLPKDLQSSLIKSANSLLKQFEEGAIDQLKLNASIKDLAAKNNLTAESTNKLQTQVDDSAKRFEKTKAKSGGAGQNGGGAKDGGFSLDKTFYAFSGLTLAANALEQAFGKSESGLAKFAVTAASAAQAASQAALLGQSFGDLAKGLIGDRGGLLGSFGKIASYAGPIGAVIGGVIGVASSIKERADKEAQDRKDAAQKDFDERMKDTEAGMTLEERTREAQSRFFGTRQELRSTKSQSSELERRIQENKVFTGTGIRDSNTEKDYEKQKQLLEEISRLEQNLSLEEGNLTKLQERQRELARQKKDRDREAADSLGERVALTTQINGLNEAYAKGENAALELRAKRQSEFIKNSIFLTDTQKQNLQDAETLTQLDEKRDDLTKSILFNTVKEISQGDLTNVDKEKLNSLRKRLEAGEKIVNIEKELNDLGIQGNSQAGLKITNALSEFRIKDGQLVVEKGITAEKQAANKEAKIALDIEKLRLSYLEQSFKNQKELEDITIMGGRTIQEAQARTPIAQLENQIATEPYATREQEAQLAKLRGEFAKLSAQRKIDNDFADVQRKSFEELRNSIISNVKGASELGDSFVKQNVNALENAKNISGLTETLEKLRKIRADLIENEANLGYASLEDAKKFQETENAIKFSEDALKKYNLSVDQAKTLLEEYNKQQQRQIEFQTKLAKLRAESPARAGMFAAFNEIEQEAYNFQETFAKNTTLAFRDGMRDALGAAISQTDDLGAALQNVATNFLKTMQNAFLQQASNQAMIGLQNAFPTVFPKASTLPAPTGAATGGFINNGKVIKGYAGGGLVTGGSGYKDDVPAMLSQGEYVIRKSSVEKYGAANLEKMNSGGMPRFAAGGDIFLPGVRGAGNISGYKDLTRFANQVTTSGATDVMRGTESSAFVNLEDQSMRLSRFALLNEDDIANQEIRSAQQQGLDLITQREKYRTEQRKAFQKQLVMTVASAALNAGIGAIAGPRVPYSSTQAGMLKAGAPNALAVRSGLAYGGMIQRYADGGPVDKIPALLMDGEYVMSNKAVKKHGKQFFDSLNQGRAPRFANGGEVGGGSEMLGEKFDNLSSKLETRGAPEVNITVNVTSSGSSETKAQGESAQGGIDYKKMSEKIKAVVLETINEEKRLGGSLRSGR